MMMSSAHATEQDAIEMAKAHFLDKPVRVGHDVFGGDVGEVAIVYDLCHEHWTDAERARNESLSALLAKADRLGANGIVGLQFQAIEHSDGSTRVLAFGEAVLLEPAPAAR